MEQQILMYTAVCCAFILFCAACNAALSEWGYLMRSLITRAYEKKLKAMVDISVAGKIEQVAGTDPDKYAQTEGLYGTMARHEVILGMIAQRLDLCQDDADMPIGTEEGLKRWLIALGEGKSEPTLIHEIARIDDVIDDEAEGD